MLSIHLEQDRVQVGDTVRGYVSVNQSIERCKTLTVHLVWAGQHVFVRRPVTETLAEGRSLEAPASFSFELTVPEDGPCSYRGKENTIRWRVEAKAEVAIGRDLVVEQTFEVAPRPVAYDLDELGGPPELKPPPDESTPWPLWLKALFWLVFGVPIAGVAILTSPFLFYWLVRRRLVHTRLRDFELYTPGLHRPLALGEWAPVAVRFRLKKAIRLERIRFVLRLVEVWKTRRETKHTKQLAIDVAETSIVSGTILALDPAADEHVVMAQAALPIPVDGTPGHGALIYYDVQARAEISGWPDAITSQRLYTRAAVLESPAPEPVAVPVEATSQGVVAVAANDAPPAGVDISTAMGSIWLWIVLPLLGFAATITSLFVEVGAPVGGVSLLLAGGVALVAVGLAGLVFHMAR